MRSPRSIAFSRAVTRFMHSLTTPLFVNGRSYDAGTFYIPAGQPTTAPILAQLAAGEGSGVRSEFETHCRSVAEESSARPASRCRTSMAASITSGWARLVLEQFEFPYKVVYPRDLDGGGLIDSFDVLILPDGADFGRPDARAGTRTQSAGCTGRIPRASG